MSVNINDSHATLEIDRTEDVDAGGEGEGGMSQGYDIKQVHTFH